MGQPITDVRLEQEGRAVTDPVILRLIETRVGEPLSPRAWRETIAHLMAMNRFDDVQVFAEPTSGGVRVKYVLLPRHPVDRIEFRGNAGVSEDDLRRVVTERFGNSPAAGRADEVAQVLRTEYRRRGFPRARVTPRVEVTHDPDRATLVLEVDAGMQAKILGVRMTQVDAEERSTIPERPAIREGQPYDDQQITRELRDWETRMRSRGYYEARAGHNAAIDADGAFVFVNLELGPFVILTFEGDRLPEAERDRLVPVRTEGSVDEDLLEDGTRAIEQFLHEKGHRDATAPFTREEAAGRLVITFRVTSGPRYIVRNVTITGNKAVPTNDLLPLLRLKEGEPFVQANLSMGAGLVENAYRARGYTRVKVTPADSVMAPERPSEPERRIAITLAIEEGPRTEVRAVTFVGNEALSADNLRMVTELAPGRPFSAADVIADRERIAQTYRDGGYESAVVVAQPTFAENDTKADVRFTITEGPQVIVDHIIIVGNRRISTETIERELLLKQGEPLGETALAQSRSNLNALGLFRRIQIESVVSAAEFRRDVLVQVEESPPTTIDLGGGVEGGYFLRPTGATGQAQDRFEISPRGFFQVGRRNLWGKNRAITLFGRVALRSRDIPVVVPAAPGEIQQFQGSYGFQEYRVLATYREPRILNTRAELQVTGILEQARRSGFNFSRREVRGQLTQRVSRNYTLSGLYSFQRTKLFDVTAIDPEDLFPIDILFPQVRLSKLSGTVLRDTRDPGEVLDPSRGTLIIASGDVAARAIGSQVGFVKTYLQSFFYHLLPVPRRTVLALGARVGAAHGFSAPVTEPVITEVGNFGLPASERFFSGGDTSVRGFALDRLANQETIDSNGFPTGGNGVIVLNSELRMTVKGPFQATGFVDAGNVYRLASDLDFTNLRPAAGFGVMYRSPFGTVRVDVGFNLDPKEFVVGSPERRTVWHVLLGQPF